MISKGSEIVSECGCGPNPSFPGEACCDCSPKVALTTQEELILKKLRSLKIQARTLVSDQKKIEEHRFDGMGQNDVSMEAEWLRISRELEDLRTVWNDWERRLEEAIDQKWIMLGHREPKI